MHLTLAIYYIFPQILGKKSQRRGPISSSEPSAKRDKLSDQFHLAGVLFSLLRRLIIFRPSLWLRSLINPQVAPAPRMTAAALEKTSPIVRALSNIIIGCQSKNFA
jgi:hypothetical protein